MKQLHLGLDGVLPIQERPKNKYYVMVYTNNIFTPRTHRFNRAYYTVIKLNSGNFCIARHEVKGIVTNADTYFESSHIQDTLQRMVRFSEDKPEYTSYEFKDRQEFLESDL